jgi:hypothetical protein
MQRLNPIEIGDWMPDSGPIDPEWAPFVNVFNPISGIFIHPLINTGCQQQTCQSKP